MFLWFATVYQVLNDEHHPKKYEELFEISPGVIVGN